MGGRKLTVLPGGPRMRGRTVSNVSFGWILHLKRGHTHLVICERWAHMYRNAAVCERMEL
jgi:hypothetical protein